MICNCDIVEPPGAHVANYPEIITVYAAKNDHLESPSRGSIASGRGDVLKISIANGFPEIIEIVEMVTRD